MELAAAALIYILHKRRSFPVCALPRIGRESGDFRRKACCGGKPLKLNTICINAGEIYKMESKFVP